MSFQEKITALMARPGQDPVAKDDVPWWMKTAGRAVGTFGGGFAILMGIWMCVTIVPLYILLGIWQILAGFILICIEAPCCCMFIDHVQKLADFADNRPYYNRALLYVAIAIPPIAFNFGFTSFFGSGFIFTTGVIYGMMALGKKASAEDMRQAAVADSASRPPNSSLHSNLVANAQPISFTGAPVFDSNV